MISISYKDLALLILFLIASGLGIYLIIAIRNINGILKNANDLFNRNIDAFDQSIEKLPHIINNIDELTLSAKDGVMQTAAALEVVGETVTDTVTSVTAGTREVAEYIKIIANIVTALISNWGKKS